MPGEFIVGGGGGSTGINPGTFTNVSVVFAPTVNNDLTTHPAVFIINFTPTATGTYQITEQGVSFTTNDATYSNLSAGPFDLTVVASWSTRMSIRGPRPPWKVSPS